MKENPIVRMFHWWNSAFADADGFSPEAFATYYSEDAELIVNGNLRGKGLAALSRHYQKLQDEFDSIEMELPVLDEFCCDDRAFVRCITRAIRGGEVIREEAMAAATLTGGKMKVLNVIGRPLK